MASLELDSLTKSYGDVRALDGLSFSVREGEIFGFVGSNGAGKTTAMRIALGVLAADSGEVRWRGVPLSLAMRRRIGYMPEERGLYPKMKVADQLSYLARLHGLSASAAAEATDEWTQRLGVAERRNTEVQQLSLGNQQRVQLAAALVHSPDILVLDEPFSGLDPVAVDIMSSVLRERASAGVPVIFSSHQLELVEQLCDRVGIIRNGRMVASGTQAELRASSGKPRWEVIVDDARPGWLADVPGVRVVSSDGRRSVVELPHDGADAEQPVLRAAVAAGTLRTFAPVVTPLAELFRHVVTDSPHSREDAA
ncbi:MAG TPA: ATP-binding cassette domain-containing protein [Actinomycetaceae bacterium]|nr:ATP-binding cassette domain-containing protein [Actinomycetaceae bacterium]